MGVQLIFALKKDSGPMLENLGRGWMGLCKYIYFCMPRGFVSGQEFVQFVRFE